MLKMREVERNVTTNARVKHYPNCKVLQVANDFVFRAPGWEPEKKKTVDGKKTTRDCDCINYAGVNHARKTCRDIALLNPFTHFVTLTLDKTKIDRYDISKIKPKLLNWLKNERYRYGLDYLLIPELHKDGAVHFHGLFTCPDGRLEASGKYYRDKPIFYYKSWKKAFGFCTLVPIDGDYNALCNYITKYIVKDLDKILGGRYYLSSRDLVREPEMTLFNVDNVDLEKYEGKVYKNPRCSLISTEITQLPKIEGHVNFFKIVNTKDEKEGGGVFGNPSSDTGRVQKASQVNEPLLQNPV